MSHEDNGVSPEEVQEFLKQQNQSVKLDLDPDTVGTLETGESQKKGEPTPVQDDPLFDPKAPTMERQFDAWSLTAPNLEQVEVTEFERTLFLKASLTDQRVILPITLEALPQHPIEVQSLTEEDMSLIYRLVHKKVADNELTGDAMYVSTVQSMTLALQVRRIGQAPFEAYLDLSKSDNPEKDLNRAAEALSRMSGARRQILLLAVRIFTLKLQLCTDNLTNGNFWNPRSTASD